jgi:glutaredoxin
VTLIGPSHSPFTHAARYILDKALIPHREYHIKTDSTDILEAIHRIRDKAVIGTIYGIDDSQLLPALFIGYRYLVGGLTELKKIEDRGELLELMKEVRKV